MDYEVIGASQEVALQFARMEITRPEVLRVTRAHKAFQSFASALRPGSQEDLYERSFVSPKISSFWSHSWHGHHGMKILTLLMLHNGRASILIGCFTALTTMMLFSLGVLPGSLGQPSRSSWALAGGFTATTMTFLFWRSQKLVFLDRICINQHDDTLKRDSIYSLGGIIRQSQEMLVLWDSTWSDRLWCQFEFSAFLNKRTDKQVLMIRPTFLGPCSCVLFIGISVLVIPVTALPEGTARMPFIGVLLLALISLYFMVAALRGFFRMVDTLREKMQSFTFDHSKSTCCDMDHVIDGDTIMCDRQIVKECVSIWFGNQEAFEDYVRSKVLENVATQLETQVFTQSWSLSVTMPFLWATFDLVANLVAAGKHEAAMARFLVGFVVWFICGPILIDSLVSITQRFSQKAVACDFLKNLAASLMVMAVFFAITCSVFLSVTFPYGIRLQRAGAFTAFWLMIAVCHLLLKDNFLSRRASGGVHRNYTRPSE